MTSLDLKAVVMDDKQLQSSLLLAGGFLAASGMPHCSIAVLQAYRTLFGDLDIPSNTLAGELIAKAQLDVRHTLESRLDK
jgi:hypothetical protein